LAWSKQVREVRAVLSVHDPYRPHLARTGFEDRWGYTLVAKWLHPQRFLDALVQHGAFGANLAAKGSATLPRFQIAVRGQVDMAIAPAHTAPGVGGGGADARVAHLDLSPSAATRLLLGRLELAAAVREGQVQATDAREPELARLAMALPWTPWVFHMLDYI
jgi:hypothetical protein